MSLRQRTAVLFYLPRWPLLACAVLFLTSHFSSPVEAQEAASRQAQDSPAPTATPSLSPRQALEQGNSQFAIGELELALELYLAGHRPEAPHKPLVYNVATTFHHLDRLPEAILWYRRGDASDPWLEENLWLARRSLGTQSLPLGGALGWLIAHRGELLMGAALFAWLSLLAALLRTKVSSGAWALSAGVALLLYVGSLLLDLKGPKEAVLMEDCSAPAGELPAGTELWYWPSERETVRVAGVADMTCLKKKLEKI